MNSEANNRRIAFVEQCFGSSGQPLVVPGRVLVGEGVLTKVCRKKPKSRQFFLFNDILVYGNILIHKKKYNQQHVIPLEEVKLEGVQDEGERKNGWKILSSKKSFIVYAATATEKKEWMSHIKKCVADLIAQRGITQNTENDSPVWVKDQDANRCMHCRSSEFTLLNRRHHCRKCGIVVCNECSSNRWLLPQQSSKPQRVCLTCFHQLSQSARNQEEANATAQDNESPDDSSDDEDSMPGSDEQTPNGQFQSYGSS